MKLVRPLLKKNPADASLNHFSGTVCQQLGDTQQAAKYLRTALQSAELSGVTWLTLAAQHTFTERDSLFERLRKLGDDFSKTNPLNQLQYHFAYGKALLDQREYDAAFDEYARGARLAPDRETYSASREALLVDSVISRYRRAESPGDASTDNGRAIFLLGLPRSGTTLLQRILSTNRKVVDGGEFAGIGVATMDFRRELDAGGSGIPGDVAASYLHLAKERFGTKGMIVDKSNNNLYYADIIADVFPGAPIILLERNALDVAWSCFRTCFNKGMPWSWALPDIAAHIRAMRHLADHWKSVMPERLVVVQYEAMVSDPERVLPDLFARCGLDFSEHVYNFYQRKGPVTTASVAQVSRPLNAHSIGSAQHVAHRMTALGSL
jgi:tetratricopeptide (TPR) repeat protein